LEECLPWLCQGDIFRSVPVLTPRVLSDASVIAVSVEVGPALLVTHGCALDKANQGVPRIERLNFLPLLAVEASRPDRQSLLRRGKLQPFEAFYLGDTPEIGESYCVLSEIYALPASYFQPIMQSFEAHPQAPDDAQDYLMATKNDSRIGRLIESGLALLLDKFNAYWTRRLPEGRDAD